MKGVKNKIKGDSGEDFVSQLAYNSFLEYWCYPNPIDEKGDKKEICDLLILFKHIAVIISVKNYNNNGNYGRYKKRVIEKSSKQLYGAERKLFQNQREVYIKHPKKSEELFEPTKYKKIYRITVNVGEQFETYEFGDIKENKGLISIFNKETFEKLIQELDTIQDFVDYLDEREKLLRTAREIIFNCQEKDLLAVFLRNSRQFPEDYYSKEFDKIILDLKDAWEHYDANKSTQLKRDADKVSYFIDNLVENDVLKLPNGEILAKDLMTLRRVERRMMANTLFSLIAKYENTLTELGRRYAEYNGIGFVFMYYDKRIPEKEFDALLPIAAQIYCYKRTPPEGIIIILAATNGLVQWKFGYFKGQYPVPSAEQERMDEMIKELGWFTAESKHDYEEKEYPDEE